MGNYPSREHQLRDETQKYWDKLLKQTTVTKAELISLSRKLDALKELKKDLYGNLANNTKAIMNGAKGRNKISELGKLQQNYETLLAIELSQ